MLFCIFSSLKNNVFIAIFKTINKFLVNFLIIYIVNYSFLNFSFFIIIFWLIFFFFKFLQFHIDHYHHNHLLHYYLHLQHKENHRHIHYHFLRRLLHNAFFFFFKLSFSIISGCFCAIL